MITMPSETQLLEFHVVAWAWKEMYLRNTLQVLSRLFSQDTAASICKAPFGKLSSGQRHFHYHQDHHHQRAVTRNKENCLLHRSFILRGYSYFRTIISSKAIFTCFALRPQASVHSLNEFCFVFQNILLLPKSAVTSNS